MNAILIQSSKEIDVPSVQIFKLITDFDLLMAFDNVPFLKGLGRIDQSQINRIAGSECIIFFEDCNSARHISLTFINDWSFSARIDNFTSLLLSPLSAVEYQFTVFDIGHQSAIVSASYHFQMRSILEMFLIKILAGKFIRKQIDFFLKRIIESSEQYKIVKDNY
ncbi:hypothetical protein [Flavobacterium saccharophilum]|uniref:Polyketide cyclase / dehydrase and lipid transport n=1 Tax=Flavobacterium saccharophilum TaxID=29534 RepID=A0A1M7FU88_9FLAO|nr:hypothetical protein [Flavobacterium saccharophilum]SHM07475.1 hypothetical protein SAMN05444366_2261 [Flavobacterium saccharophilum]